MALLAAVVLAAAACTSPGARAPAGPASAAASTGPAKAVVPPGTPAGAQLRWLITALLASTVDREPLPPVAAAGTWVTPRDINSLEYFASASDICRAYASLAALARQPGLSRIGQVLSLNDEGLQLDPARWQATWFKGGSEPGVLALSYLATTRTGRSYVVAVLAENPSQPIDESTAIPAILSAIKGAFTLAAR